MDKPTCEDIEKVVEILKNQLYFVIVNGGPGKKLKSTNVTHYFSIDEEFVYQNYYHDFGPLNISCLYKYCCKLNKCLRNCKGIKQVVHYTCNDLEKKSNAAYLIGVYAIIYLRLHPKTVTKILYEAKPYKPFLDASQYPYRFELKLSDIFHAVAKAVAYNFVNFFDFNDQEYDMFNKLQYGDMNWLLPRKFLAFIGPTESAELSSHTPEFYVKYFLKNDVKTVIRLNNKAYNSAVFTDNGIQHHDLIFPDGSNPPKEVLLKFLEIVEATPMAIAVHCKAGLGRTGSLIGAYIVKHFHFTAKEAIAWLRLCRPGSVIGQQQLWLEKIESWLWRCGCLYRCEHFGDGEKIPRFKYGIYSKIWPQERDKLIENVRRKMRAKSKFGADRKGSDEEKKRLAKFHRFKRRLPNYEQNREFKEISKMLSVVHGIGKSNVKNQPKLALLTAEANKKSRHSATDPPQGKIDVPRSAGNEIMRVRQTLPEREKICTHKEIQGDQCSVGHRLLDNTPTCVEMYSPRYNRSKARLDQSQEINKIHPRGYASWEYKNPALSIHKPKMFENPVGRKYAAASDLQGDRLMFIKANKMQ